jgi:hypothetical protein
VRVRRRKIMKKKSVLYLVVVLIFLCESLALADDLQLTPAEESDWQRTTSSQEVVDYSKYIAERSGGRIRYETIGYTPEGRPISLMVMGYPSAPKDETEVGANRIVMYVQSSIHAGEVEGKEAMLIFAREVAQGKHDELLKNIVVLINPNANPDGADALGEWRIRSQPTPKLVGTRYNAQGYNLNRDYTKIEAPETQAALRIVLKWDAAVFVDAHATDGLRHRHPVVFDCGKNANNDPRIQEANRQFGVSMFDDGSSFRRLMKEATDRAVADGRVVPNENYNFIPPYSEGYASSAYDGMAGYVRIINTEGKSEDIPTTWEGGGGEPRLSKTLLTVKNRFGILLECHSHNDYEYRVNTQYAAIYSAMEQMGKQKDDIKALFKAVDDENRNRTSTEGVEIAVIGQRVNADWIEPGETEPGKVTISGYRFAENADGDRLRGGAAGNSPADLTAPEEWSLRNYTRFIAAPGTETRMGAIYIFEPAVFEGVKLLMRHGIEVKRVTADGIILRDFMQFDNGSGTWGTLTRRASGYEGHFTINTSTISADWVQQSESAVPKGYYVVSTAQPLGKFAAFMLEPKSEDGLCFWNYYDTPLFSAERGTGKFDIRKTYSFGAIPESALESVDMTPDVQPTPEADVLETIPQEILSALPSGLVLGQEAGYVTLSTELEEMESLPDVVKIGDRYYISNPEGLASSFFSPLLVEAASSLPVIRFTVTESGSTGVVTLSGIDGKNILSAIAKEVNAVKVTKTGELDKLTIVHSPKDLSDGKFILSTTGVGHILQENDPIAEGTKFDVTIAIKDDGKFDLNPKPNVVGDPIMFVKTKHQNKNNGGGGCSVGLVLPLIIIALSAAFICSRRYTSVPFSK